MKQIFITILALNIFILNAQKDVLVEKNDQAFITIEDFKNKFGYTLDHDKTQSKEAILDYYLTMRLKSEEARKLQLDASPKFVNNMLKFIGERKDFYLEQDPFYKEMQEQFKERAQKEIQIIQYFIEGIDESQAVDYQSKLVKDIRFFDQIKKVKRVESRYYTVGELPYGLEEEIFSDLKKGRVLELQQGDNQQFVFTVIEDIRPYSGTYKFQLLLIKDTLDNGKEKIDAIYKQVLKGTSFNQLVKEFSEDQNSKERPFVTLNGVALDTKILNILNPLNEGEISKPFKTEFGWNLVKLIEHNLLLNDTILNNRFKNSIEYGFVLKGYKVNYINEKLNPVEEEYNVVKDLKNKRLIALFKKDSISKENYEKELTDIVTNEIKEKKIVTFSNGMSYTNWNFIADNSVLLRMMYKENIKNVEEKIKEQLPISIVKSKVQLFDNMQDQFNPQFKKEVELLEASLLTDLYDQYMYDKALNDKDALLEKYETMKSHYKWDERVEVIMAYCNSDHKMAKEIETALKENKTIEALQQQYAEKNVYFRRIKRELSSTDLPKGYSKEKGIKIYEENGDYFVTKTEAILPSQYPTYDELKPIVEKKYKEEYLDREVSNLKKQIKINQSVLNNL